MIVIACESFRSVEQRVDGCVPAAHALSFTLTEQVGDTVIVRWRNVYGTCQPQSYFAMRLRRGKTGQTSCAGGRHNMLPPPASC